jgi:hypothetical protein
LSITKLPPNTSNGCLRADFCTGGEKRNKSGAYETPAASGSILPALPKSGRALAAF